MSRRARSSGRVGLGTPETCLLCGCARRLPAFHTPAPAALVLPPILPLWKPWLLPLGSAPPHRGQLLPAGVSSSHWGVSSSPLGSAGPARLLPLLTITTSLAVASRTLGPSCPAVTRTIHANPTLSDGWLLTPLLHSPLNCHLTTRPLGTASLPRDFGSQGVTRLPGLSCSVLGPPQEEKPPLPGRNPAKRIRTLQARPLSVDKGPDEDVGCCAPVLPPHRPRRS